MDDNVGGGSTYASTDDCHDILLFMTFMAPEDEVKDLSSDFFVLCHYEVDVCGLIYSL